MGTLNYRSFSVDITDGMIGEVKNMKRVRDTGQGCMMLGFEANFYRMYILFGSVLNAVGEPCRTTLNYTELH